MSLAAIQAKFERVSVEGTDMREHMPKLKEYASRCPRVVEFGVWDCTSTWGLLAGAPVWMRSYDVIRKDEVNEVEALVKNTSIDFQFVLASSIEVELPEVDLLFIDSLHTYAQLKTELALHHAKVSKLIILHDTTTFGEEDQFYHKPGLWPAVQEFLAVHGDWRVKERLTNCHGLTVLERYESTRNS